jgi:hypothetical protein
LARLARSLNASTTPTPEFRHRLRNTPPTTAARYSFTPISGWNTNTKNGPMNAAHSTTKANRYFLNPSRSWRNP